jgi:hypothetical protein
MGLKPQQIREKIFEIFSKNLTEIKSHPSIRFKPEFENGYICPLCFDAFFEYDLSQRSNNPLTLEDVPPKSLGGNPKVLTCKKCNSKSGHELDKQLLLRLHEIDIRGLLPNSEHRTTFSRGENKANGSVKVDSEGKIIFDIRSEISDPKSFEKFMKDVFPPRKFYNPLFYPEKEVEQYKTNEFRINLPERSSERRSEIAILRIGYLLAFSILGNAFLINGPLFGVRDQILNPDKKVLSSVFWIKYEFPEEMIGMNIIKEPKELRCFLAIFNLKTKSRTRQYAIALPGPSEPGIKIYDNIEKILCVEEKGFQNLEIEHIPDINFVRDIENAWGGQLYWQEFAEDKKR